MKKAIKQPKAQVPPETKSKEQKGAKPVGTDEQNIEDGRMDFGGLPDRDLKKNLGGCG